MWLPINLSYIVFRGSHMLDPILFSYSTQLFVSCIEKNFFGCFAFESENILYLCERIKFLPSQTYLHSLTSKKYQ